MRDFNMTEDQWNASSDATAMLEFVLNRKGITSDSTQHAMGYRMNSGAVKDAGDFETQLHRFYVACCQSIWKLLPDSSSRNGIDIAEKWLDGTASDSELNQCNWTSEGAAFGIDYKTAPDQLEDWILKVDAIPKNELKLILAPSVDLQKINSYDLLKRAAYFANFVTRYSAMSPNGLPRRSYHIFLSAQILRQHLKYAP